MLVLSEMFNIYIVDLFYIHGSVHRNSILTRSNKIEQYAGIYLLQNYSKSFGCPSHPSSGVHKNVAAASGTGHITYLSKTFLQSGLEEGFCPDRAMTCNRRLQLHFNVLLIMGAMDTRNM